MTKIVTQDKLNELSGLSIDLGKGGGYCPTYKEITDNWGGSETVTLKIIDCNISYDPGAQDGVIWIKVQLSKPLNQDIRISMYSDDLWIYAGQTVKEFSWNDSYNSEYVSLGSVYDSDDNPVPNLEVDKTNKYLGALIPGTNYASVSIDSQANFTVTFDYPVDSELKVKVRWEEENYDGYLCDNYSYAIVPVYDMEASGHGAWNCGGNYTTNAVIDEIIPSSDKFQEYVIN